jgi:hypothetical protein
MGDIVERAHLRMPLHVGLACQDVDFEGFRFHAGGGEKYRDQECGGVFHGWKRRLLVFSVEFSGKRKGQMTEIHGLLSE